MSSSPDLTLPPTAPTEQYQEENHDASPFAVYTLVDLGQRDSSNELLKAIEGEDENFHTTCMLAPSYDFNGQPLMSVYEYHLELAKERKHHPTMFIVAHQPDYEQDGVLLVNLDVDLDCRVDTCRIKAADAASAMVNIRIANIDWEDFKEQEPPSEDSPTRSVDSRTAAETSQQPPPSSSSAVLGLYTTAGANMTTLPQLLAPESATQHPKDHRCRSVASYAASPDPWAQLRGRHPWNCMRDPSLHRQMFVCADKTDVETEGVLLVRLQWDGDIDRDPAQLIRIGTEATVQTRRCRPEGVLADLAAVVSGETGFESSTG